MCISGLLKYMVVCTIPKHISLMSIIKDIIKWSWYSMIRGIVSTISDRWHSWTWNMKESCILLYADYVGFLTENVQDLQFLEVLNSWQLKNGLIVNCDKSKVIYFSTQSVSINSYQFMLNLLPSVFPNIIILVYC